MTTLSDSIKSPQDRADWNAQCEGDVTVIVSVLEVVVAVAGATVVGRSVGDRVVGPNDGAWEVGRIDGDATVTI